MTKDGREQFREGAGSAGRQGDRRQDQPGGRDPDPRGEAAGPEGGDRNDQVDALRYGIVGLKPMTATEVLIKHHAVMDIAMKQMGKDFDMGSILKNLLDETFNEK